LNNLDPTLIARAIHVVATCGGIIALVFGLALYDEYRIRKHKTDKPPAAATATAHPAPAQPESTLVDV
jgi:hypothetical protein